MFSVFAIAMAILALQALLTVIIVSAFVGGNLDKTAHTVANIIAGLAMGWLIGWFMPSVVAMVALLAATCGVDYAIRQYAVMRMADQYLNTQSV